MQNRIEQLRMGDIGEVRERGSEFSNRIRKSERRTITSLKRHRNRDLRSWTKCELLLWLNFDSEDST
jgi:hypothetical protein